MFKRGSISYDNIIKILKLGRLHFLLSGFLLFLFGSLLAILLSVQFVIDKFLLGYAIILTAQLSVSYSNDYFDFEVDRVNESTFS